MAPLLRRASKIDQKPSLPKSRLSSAPKQPAARLSKQRLLRRDRVSILAPLLRRASKIYQKPSRALAAGRLGAIWGGDLGKGEGFYFGAAAKARLKNLPKNPPFLNPALAARLSSSSAP